MAAISAAAPSTVRVRALERARISFSSSVKLVWRQLS